MDIGVCRIQQFFLWYFSNFNLEMQYSQYCQNLLDTILKHFGQY